MRKKKILIIDDQDLVRAITSRNVSFAGFDPVVARGADEGLAIARTQPIRLILLDIMMPGKNGFEALQELRKDPKTKAIPVIVITALHSKTDVEANVLAGATKIISKPVDWRELNEEMKRILGTSLEDDPGPA